MERIFYENRCFYIIGKDAVCPSGLQANRNPDHEDELSCHVIYTDLFDLHKFFKKFLKSPEYSVYTVSSDQYTSSEIFSDFCRKYEMITAAGGIVRRKTPLENPHKTTAEENSRYLYILRNGHWDLPKGKQEKGESFQDTAYREIAEETGIENTRIISNLPTTYHVILKKGEVIIKRCIWYVLEQLSNTEFAGKPQLEEGIQEVSWLSAKEVRELYPKMFASVAYVSCCFFNEVYFKEEN